MSERIEMVVKMQVTKPQGLALQAMFEHWNRLASWGSSRAISFYVDGDGDFKPKADITFNSEMPILTDNIAKKAICKDTGDGNIGFDFDCISSDI